MKLFKNLPLLGCFGLMLLAGRPAGAVSDAWYTEGNFAPKVRIEFTITNTLDFDRPDCPVVIPRSMLPLQNVHEMSISVVDPSRPGRPEPSPSLRARQGGHLMREETNGWQHPRQLDDLDRNGVWDEIFFQTDLAAGETKTMYLYIGFSQRGWHEHGTHAAIGSYCRHLVPFWESEHMGWKLWYGSDVDMYGKRTPRLMSQDLYMLNLNGYGVPYEDGSDIQTVSASFGAGGIGVFEDRANPEVVSRPRFTPAAAEMSENPRWNASWLDDTRYAFEVVVNGPMRSIILVRTLNWRTGHGEYEVEQIYTAYTNQSYSTCEVRFTSFHPERDSVEFAAGIRRNANESEQVLEGGTVITIGDEEIVDPTFADEDASRITIDFVGNALIVKDVYQPRYQFVPEHEGNHTFRVKPTADLAFEYLIAGAWSEGQVYNTPEAFKQYVKEVALGYNHPPIVRVNPEVQTKVE